MTASCLGRWVTDEKWPDEKWHVCGLPTLHDGGHQCGLCFLSLEVPPCVESKPLRIVDCVPAYITEDKINIGEHHVYWMIGKCWNCGDDGFLMRFLRGDKVECGQCPTCGVGDSHFHYNSDGVHSYRLATPEEIPQKER